MAFKPGNTAGRKKGTPNKATLPLEQKALELGVDPFEILLRFAGGDWKGLGYKSEAYEDGFTISPEMRLKAASEACQYLLAKKKAIELSNPDNSTFRVLIEDYSSKK